VLLPTLGRRPTGKGSKNTSTSSGCITKSPSGFFQSHAILARNLLGATPDGSRQLEFHANLLTNRARDLRCGGQAGFVLGNIEISFVEGQRLNEIGVPAKDVTHLA